MTEYAAVSKLIDASTTHEKNLDQFYSVEIPVNGFRLIYQFKIWRVESRTMFVLVKENSDLLQRIKLGDKLNLKYYSKDLIHPCQYLDTEISDIIKQDKGRLKGHYLVGLETIESNDEEKLHWPANHRL